MAQAPARPIPTSIEPREFVVKDSNGNVSAKLSAGELVLGQADQKGVFPVQLEAGAGVYPSVYLRGRVPNQRNYE